MLPAPSRAALPRAAPFPGLGEGFLKCPLGQDTGEVTADTDVTFRLVVNDGLADSAAASVTVTVHNVNRAPVAVAKAPSSLTSIIS